MASGTVVASLPARAELHEVVITDIPVAELLAAEEAMDDLLRELQLHLLAPDRGDSSSDTAADTTPGLTDTALISQRQRPLEGDLLIAAHLDSAARGFEFARRQIREQVTHAGARGEAFVTLRLDLHASTGQSAAYYRDAVAAAEDLQRVGRHSHQAHQAHQTGWQSQVRGYYLDEVIRQLATP